jgi:hypothetical protein
MNAAELEVLDDLVPSFENEADWDDVLRRAGVARERRWRRTLAVALTAAVVVPAAAFGVSTLLHRSPTGIGLAAHLRGAFTGELSLDVHHTILARRRGEIVVRPLVRLGGGRIQRGGGAPVRWSLEREGKAGAARSTTIVLDSGRRVSLCAPCRASGGTTRLDRQTLAALVNGRASVVAVTGAGTARGRMILLPRH